MTDIPPEPPVRQTSWVRQLVDFGALVAFVAAFVVLRVRGLEQAEALIQATWVLIGASVLALAVGLLVERRLAFMPLLVGGFALVFGLLTVIFHNEEIIKIKLTVMNGLLAALLLGGLAMKRNFARMLLGSALPLREAAWRTLTLRYGLYFAACAIANEVVRLNVGEDGYMTFRSVLWVAALIFSGAQVPLIFRELKAAEADQDAGGEN